MKKLDSFFNPNVIAVVGATSKSGHVGYAVMQNLIGHGYEGIVYPINPKRKSVLGIKAYPSITQVPDKVDLVVISTPASTVLSIVEDCGKLKISNIVILTAGFNEAGSEGTKLFEDLQQLIRKYGIRVLGPNCLGFLRPSKNLNVSFSGQMALPGSVAFISQSGALGTAILDWSLKQKIGFSYFISVGAMIDIGFDDLIDFFGQDPNTSCILIYMESLTHSRRFLSAARAFAKTKPIIVLKVGISDEGAKAAMSHTGSLTGDDAVFNAAFKRAGVLRVQTIGELFSYAKTLAMQKIPTGNRLAVVTNAGGPGVIATDALIQNGGKLAKLTAESMDRLNQTMPPMWSRRNPVDILGDADDARYKVAVEVCLTDPNVDGILVILTPQAMTNPESVARSLVQLAKFSNKTILASWMGESQVQQGREILKKGKIPVFRVPETAVRTFLGMYQYSKNLEFLHETPPTISSNFKPNTVKNNEIIAKAFEEKRNILTGIEAYRLLENYEIPVAKSELATSKNEASKIASKIGFPVAMKIVSPEIVHKTDFGGVRLHVQSAEEASKVYSQMTKEAKKHFPKAEVHGVLIQEMFKGEHELLIGSKKDPIFGPIIVFGMGGVAVEVFKDIKIGLPPLNMILARKLIEETKIFKLLKGYRGMDGVNLIAIEFLLYKFAYLLMDFPEIQEIDINPFSVNAEKGIVLDAKVVLDPSVKRNPVYPYSHLVISPYPKEYIKHIKLKNGKQVTLRPICPEDEPMEAEMFTKFSENTQRFRFFTLIKDVTHQLLVRYTQIDYDREIAIIAELKEKGKPKMAGVVRLIADAYNDTAEFAIVVADPWQNQGLGKILMDYILEIARKRQIHKIYAHVLPDNHIMLKMFKARNFEVHRDGNLCEAELVLSPSELS